MLYRHRYLVPTSGLESGMWVLIAPDPGRCMFVTFNVQRMGENLSHLPIESFYQIPEIMKRTCVTLLKSIMLTRPCIRITCPCDLYPLAPHFYIVKLGFTRVYMFSYFCSKT